MKQITIHVLIISTITAMLSSGAQASREAVEYVAEDHLVPRNPEIDGPLRPELEKKLFLAPADFALLLIRPPEKGESAVMVYSQGHEGIEATYRVTLAEAEANFDMTLAAADGEIEALSKIRVNRCDAEISSSTALAVRDAWQAMLQQTRKPDVYARPTLHREEFEFSIIMPGTKPIYATLPNKGGKLVSRYVRLGRLLAGYCKAPPLERSRRAEQIERDAKRLVLDLRSRKTEKPSKSRQRAIPSSRSNRGQSTNLDRFGSTTPRKAGQDRRVHAAESSRLVCATDLMTMQTAPWCLGSWARPWGTGFCLRDGNG
jgi:hypothetical protein